MREFTLHQPVLLKEVIEWLRPSPGDVLVDATLGLGGHTKELLKAIGPQGRLLALDWDRQSVEKALPHLPKSQNLVIKIANFKDLEEVAKEAGFSEVQSILFDLGLNLWQIKESGRGFSFEKDEPLDMRLNPNQKLTAFQLVNHFTQKELTQILKESDERYAHQIAKAIIETRKIQPIRRTSSLRQIVEKICAKRSRRHRLPKIHPATKTFQAIRVVVNQERDSLKQGLKGAVAILKKGGRVVVISFHSGEDRVVKQFFRETPELKILTKKPIIPSEKEVKENPRSRSAKLRVAEKIT